MPFLINEMYSSSLLKILDVVSISRLISGLSQKLCYGISKNLRVFNTKKKDVIFWSMNLTVLPMSIARTVDGTISSFLNLKRDHFCNNTHA